MSKFLDVIEELEKDNKENKEVTSYSPNSNYNFLYNAYAYDGMAQTYKKAKEEADKHYEEAIKGEKDRNKLTDIYINFANRAQQAAESNDANGYLKNYFLAQNTADDVANIGSGFTRFANKLGDLGESAFLGVRNTVAGIGDTLYSAGLNMDYLFNQTGSQPVLSLKPNFLYSIAASDSNHGFSENYWELSGANELARLSVEYPNNKDIAKLYDIVKNRNYKGSLDSITKLTDNIKNFVRNEKYEAFRDEYTRSASLDNARQEVKKSLTYDPFDQYALGSAKVVGGMVPAIGASLATGNVLGALGWGTEVVQGASTAASLTALGAGAYGSAFNEALDSGNDWTKSTVYATLVAGAEVGSEVLGGEAVNSLLFTHTVSTPAGQVAKQIVDKLGLKSTLARGTVAGLLDVGAEGFEEMLTQALDPVFKSLVLEDNSGWEDYGISIGQAFIESILPTIILGGAGKVQISKEIDLYGKAYVNAIQESKSLTDAQKGEMIKGWEKAVKDAKAGFTQNYVELKDSIMNQLEEADIKNADTLTYALTTAFDDSLTDEERRANIQKYAQEHGGIYNESQATSQELKDTATTKNVTYKGTDKIDLALNDFRIKNAGATIETVNEINNVQSTIKDLIERITGKQVVYVNPSSTTNTYYGFMNDDGNVYINSNLNAKDTLGAANHEIGHYVKSTNQELYDEFVSKANLTPEKIENYRRQVDDSLTDDQVKEEMFGDYIGEIMSKYKNTKAVEQSVLTLWDKVKRIAQDIGGTVLGTERQGRITDYNLSGLSYLEGDILNDTAFEQKVLDTFKSLKNVDQVKEATKKTKEITKTNVKTPSDDVKTRIEEKYKAFDKKLVNMKTVKEMIANELGVEHNDPQVDEIYKQLKKYGEIGERIKLSKRKNEPEKLQEAKNIFANAKGNVKREIIVEIGTSLPIFMEDTYELVDDTDMKAKSGKNKNPSITKIDNWLKNFGDLDRKSLRQRVLAETLVKFRDKVFQIKDTQSEVEINKSGVDKSISKNAQEDKFRSMHVLDKIIQEGIYGYTTIDTSSDDGILYHSFFSPVNYDGENGLIRLVIKEYTRNKTQLDKYYYHQFEYLNIKNDDNSTLPRKSGSKVHELSSSKDIIPPKRNEVKFSSRKETNTEKIINNQRNEIERLSTQADDLKKENKGLKKIIKGLKSTGRQQIRNVQSESNKMLRTGREQELKMKGQLEREGKKYNRLSEVAVDLKFENQLAEKARADGISFPREYKDLFIGLRRAGDSIKDAYNLTRSIFDESQVVNKSIDNSINILKELRKRKVYNKLPNDIKAKINKYANIWVGSRNQSNLTLAKRVLNSLTARELRENGVNLTNAVRNQIMSEEGYGWENGKGSKSLQELFKGSKEVAQAFEQELVKLRQEVADFQARNFLAERTKQLEDTIIKMQDEVSNELGKQKKGFKKNVLKTNSTLLNTLMTFKTEIQALMGGNENTALMQLNDNLQKGEVRKKQAVADTYNILSKFMQRSKGLNYALNTERWSPSLEKSLSNKSAFVDTGMVAYDKNGHKVSIKIPRSMMMSLAMHLLNQDNMSHISGAATQLTTDDSGNAHITYGKGQGVRIPDETLFRAGKEKEAYDSGVTVRLLEDQVEAIADMLTGEEKAFVKAVGEVFKHTSELINEVSNRIVGYDMATVENYFPIRVWDGTKKQQDITSPTIKKEMYGDALAYMLNPGWLQERVTSFNPIYLENIAEVMNRVVNNVANFYGYAEALRDNNILLHSAMPNGTTFSKSIDDLSSSFMTNYNRLTRFITGQESLKDGKFRGLMAMNTLTFNIGTWLTQPMSFFNTIKYFSGKEFLSSLSPINNNIKLNKMIRNYFDEMGIDHTEYNDYQVARAFIAMATPNLENRAIGYKIPQLSQLYNKNIENKLGAHGIEAFDNIAVTAIARMMAYSVSLDPNIKFGSEEYFDVLGERLTQVLVETQPEFSQVNRANMFRSSNPVLRMLSLFGTPANQMFNNFAQSALQLRYEAREGKVSQNAITTLIKSASGIVLSSVLVGLVRALRDSIRAGDDDDTEFVDKWIAQSIVSILGPTLILDDVAQFVMGQTEYGGMSSYDFNTPETTFMNGFQNLGEKLVQLGKEDVSPAKKTKDIIRAIGVITPIDTKSMVRIVEALMKFIAPDMYGAYQLQNNTTIYKQWLKNSDTDMATFYKAYTATRPKVLEEKYGYHKADKAKGIKSNLKEAREKALKDVLKNQKEVNKYMEILFDYKN